MLKLNLKTFGGVHTLRFVMMYDAKRVIIKKYINIQKLEKLISTLM